MLDNLYTSLTWDNARAAVNRGGHLATITTQEEWDYLLTLGLTNQMWLGGTDLNDEGNWRWLIREMEIIIMVMSINF